jgi:hypothetical protein
MSGAVAFGSGMTIKLTTLLVEIRRRARVRPARDVDPLQEIMRRIGKAPRTPENRAMLKIAAAAISRREENFNENEIWSLSQEALGLLNALIEQRGR